MWGMSFYDMGRTACAAWLIALSALRCLRMSLSQLTEHKS